MRPTINNLRGQKKHSIDNVISDDKEVRKSIKEVPKEIANVEAEKGESVLAPGMGFFDIGGQKHYAGGTHLMLPPGSFVFSDDKDSKITGAALQMFGKNPDKNFTPAEISKSYELNKYLAILKDPDADHHSKVTAELMIDNNTKKLAELAFLQEGMKGFPDGPPNLDDVKTTMMKKGGSFPGLGQIFIDLFEQFDPSKGDKNEPRAAQKAKGLKRGFNKFDAPWLSDFGYDNNLGGFKKAIKSLGYTGKDDVKAMQQFLVEENYKKGNFDLFNSFYKNYGATNQGVSKGLKDFPEGQMSMQDLIKDLVDGNAGVRTGALAKSLLGSPKVGNLVGDKKNIDPLAPQASTPMVGDIIGNLKDLEPLAPTLNTPVDKASAPKIKPNTADNNVQQDQEIKLGLNTLQKMDLGNTLFDMATVRKGRPTRYQNYGLEQAAGIAANVRPYDYQSILNEVSKQAAGAYRANSTLGAPAGARAAANAAIFGQAAEQASKIKMDEYNQNAGLYNANQQQLGQFASAIGEDKMKNAMLYNDRVEMMNANYDQEVKMLKNQALSRLNEYMANNQAIMYDNMLHPEFTFDPGSGFAGTMSFNPRENVFGGGSGAAAKGNTGSQLESMTAYIQNTFGIKDKEKALSYALQALRSQQPFDDAALGSNMFMNPFLRQSSGRGGRGRGTN